MNTLTKLSKLLCMGIALFEAAAIGNAQTILTFDDISTANFTVIPNGYGGLDWSNFLVQNTSVTGGFDYANGMVSSPNVAINGNDGSPAWISSSSAFTLDSAYIMPLGSVNEYINVYGFSGGTEVYANSYSILHSSPTLINFDYANVDTVEFSVPGNAPFTMDNMAIAVPEPSTCALASLVVAFGLMSRRKKSRSE